MRAFCLIGFEGAILLGTLGNLLGLVFHAGLYRLRRLRFYDPIFGEDRFALRIACNPEELDRARALLREHRPGAIKTLGGEEGGP